jgi:putative restriction endonuclease
VIALAAVDPDQRLRAAAFLALDALRARWGDDLPYWRGQAKSDGRPGGLELGFAFDGHRVAFLNPQKGIHRAREQRGPAALSIMTSANSPYRDEMTDEGLSYAYRTGAPEIADNRALRAAHEMQVPIVYFVAPRPGWFTPVYPCFVIDRDDAMRRVLVLPPGQEDGREETLEPTSDVLMRRYATRVTLTRLHQARFRGRVLPAYRDRCAVCRLRERRLLDAAHIVADRAESGEAVVSNGLTLCSIHHRAFDGHLMGISADYQVRLARRLLDEEDGPMLDLLKDAHGTSIELPSRVRDRPDRERLAARFEAFSAS